MEGLTDGWMDVFLCIVWFIGARGGGSDPPMLLTLTCFDVDAGAANLARLVLSSAEVLVVMYDAVVGGGGERVELKRAVGVHMADVGHIVNVVSGGQVPAKDGMGGAARRAGQGHPH